MKKFTILISLMIISSSILFAQNNSDIDPNAVRNPNATTFTDDLFEELFQFPCGDCSGEAGIETNGDYIYTSKWNGEGFFCYEMDGTFLGWFAVPGTAAVRDMAYDGTYFYGAAASTQLFEMDFVGQSGVLISTLTAAVTTRACAYDAEFDAFWGNNWSDPITLYDRSGGILNQFNCGVYESYYGFAYVVPSNEGPWLFGFSQSGGASQAVIVQIDPEVGYETGVVFDAIEYSTTGTGSAGGLAEFNTYAPGYWALLGIIQNETIFGLEVGWAPMPPTLDLALKEILDPNTGFALGIEYIVIKVKNQGTLTQSNFDVKYQVDGGAYVTETISGPLTMGESIIFTFNQAYDFSAIGEYFIEAKVILENDENPLNNTKQKIVENLEPNYCEASTINEDEWIANVLLHEIDNSSGWQAGVADYTDLYATVGIGTPAEIIVTNGNPWASDKVTVWCDWNDDFIFDNEIGSNEKFVLINDGTGAVFTGDITAPAIVLAGPHRMRIRMTYNDDPEPCDGSSYGEVEDYTVIAGGGGILEITWNPNSFSQFVGLGQTAQDFLNIGNIGTIPLQWAIEVIFPPSKDSLGICLMGEAVIPWLSVNPIEGAIQPQSSEAVTLNFNAGDWPTGTELNANLILYSADPSNPAIYIPVTMIIGEPPEPHFNFEGGDPSSPLWTIYIGSATIGYSYTDLVAGDEIAIFDGGLMVGAFTLNQVCTPSNQFDNDLTAFSVLSTQAGYQVGNEFAFKCWDASEQIESDLFIYEFFDPYGDAYTGDVFPDCDGNYSIAEINFLPLITQSYNLSVGYQFISSNVIPDDPDMLLVLSDILNDNLDFVRNTEGQMLRKIGDVWVNGIGDWIIEEGYLIRMFNEDSFSIEGLFADPETQISLTEGYQIVSFLPSVSVDAFIAFQSIIGDNLNFIRNSNGQTLHKIGPHWINGIGNCYPGEGYLIKMFTDDILNYSVIPAFSCGEPLIDYRDGQIYNSVQIGNQCWMAENLNIGIKINSDNYPTNNGLIEKYCYDNDNENCEIYGGLYQWDEMMQYSTTTQGICQDGWHLPSDAEWFMLENYIDPSINNPDLTGWRGTDCGLKMLEGGSSGFEGLLAGYKDWDSEEFLMIGERTYFRSTTFYVSPYSYYRAIESNNLQVYRNSATKSYGFSVRCLRDEINKQFPEHSSKSSIEEGGTYQYLNKKTSMIPNHFVVKEGNPMEPVWIIYIEKGTLNIGDEIGIYDDDILTGAGIVNSENILENPIPVFSNLYKTGNLPIIKVWDKTENQEYFLTDYTFSNPYGDAWTENVFPAEDGEYSLIHFTATGISDKNENYDISIYPNPSSGIITIGNLAGFQNLQGLEITNITGKIVFQTTIINNYSSIEIDLSHLEKGIYLISFYGKNFNQFEKIVIQ